MAVVKGRARFLALQERDCPVFGWSRRCEVDEGGDDGNGDGGELHG